MIVLDTHVLVWWVSSPEKIPAKVKTLIAEASETGGLLVSVISVWEICMLVKEGRLRLTMGVDDWIEKIEELPIKFVPVDNNIAAISVSLEGFVHRDPADRIIIATALREKATLVTKDKKIRTYRHVMSAW